MWRFFHKGKTKLLILNINNEVLYIVDAQRDLNFELSCFGLGIGGTLKVSQELIHRVKKSFVVEWR